MAEGPLLEIEDFTFRYRRATEPALRNVWLRLDPGEVLLVAGPSGCGKSTLIRAINGLIPHSYRGELSGTVRVAGRFTGGLRLRDLAEVVGTVLQDPRKQLVASTVEGELAFGPENLGLARDEIRHRVMEAAAATGIEHLLGRTTDQLSGGESQLLAIGGALMLRPQILVLDEPLANLDPVSAQRLTGIVRTLADAGTGIVIVEHRVEDALHVRPDRVLYLEDGVTRYGGDVDGFLAVADPRQVKLPFDVVLRRVRSGPMPAVSPAAESSVRDAVHWSADEPPRLEWDGVDAGYDEEPVLHGVAARLGRHERVAVLGPNGSGKTTLFKAALGLVSLTGGEVRVDGRSIHGRSVAVLASIFGYVFQNPSQMLFAPSARDEILFGPRNSGRDPSTFDGLVTQSLDRVNLAGVADIESRPPLTLSFGQQKRLTMAIALALRPRTLVLDEPSAGQDHRSSTDFMSEAATIEGLESVYFVTHDVDLALTFADRILLMRDGRIVGDGRPLEVIADRDRWAACNLRFTSLMEANARHSSGTGRFLAADELAQRIVRASGVEGDIGPQGGRGNR